MRRMKLAALLGLCMALGATACDPIVGDVDGSGIVDLADLTIVQGCFGSKSPLSPGCAPADVNGDGAVDILDISIVSSALATPEVPNVLGLSVPAAQTALVAKGFALGTATEANSVVVASGLISGQSFPPGSVQVAGTPVDVVVSAPVGGEAETLGAAWHAAWEVRTTTRDGSGGTLAAVDEDLVDLCLGDPLGLSLLPPEVLCTGSTDDDHLAFDCTAQATVGGCTIDTSVDMLVERISPTELSGGGAYQMTVSGLCDGIAADEAATVEFYGKRTFIDPASCAGPTASVSQKLLRNSQLIGVLP